MNIFRILAQGDGTINEPNVSAFLGYLLNPNEDHGLGSRFLEVFLELHCRKAEKTLGEDYSLKWLFDTGNEPQRIKDLSTNSNFEVNVFFEQAFGTKEDAVNKKEIVDIILIVHEVEKDSTEKHFKNYIQNKRKLRHIFLIEVKISDNAVKLPDDDAKSKKNDKVREGQLIAQVQQTKNEIKKLLDEIENGGGSKSKFDINKDISCIYVTPDPQNTEKSKAEKAFAELDKTEFSNLHRSHIIWNKIDTQNNQEENKKDDSGSDDRNALPNEEMTDAIIKHSPENKNKKENSGSDDIITLSIEEMIDAIIKPSPEAKAEPLPQYTIDTLQSFSNFVYSGFSYKLRRPKGISTKDTYTYMEYGKFKSDYSDSLSGNSWDRIEAIKGDILNIDKQYIRITHSKTHPISVAYTKYTPGSKCNKIFSFKNDSKNLCLHLLTKKNDLKNVEPKLFVPIEEKLKAYVHEENLIEETHGLTVKKITEIPNETIIELIEELIKIIDAQHANQQ